MRDPRLRVIGAAALLSPPLLFLALFFAYPLSGTLRAATPAAWSWFAEDYAQSRLRIALVQAALSTLLTLALAIPLAWLHHRYRIRWSRAHLALHAAPFVLPVFVVVYGIQGILGHDGLLHQATRVDLLGALGPLGAVVIAHAYYNYGFAARAIAAALDRRPRRLEEAAQVLGASGRGAFWRVSLPLLLPTLASVALLAFLFCFTSFGVVLFMGSGRVSTLETMLYQNLGGVFPRYDRAAVLGVVQLGLNLALFAGYLLLARSQRELEKDPDAPRERAPVVARVAAWGALALGLLPALSVLVGGFRVRGAWTIEPWRAIFDAEHPEHLGGFDLGRALLLSLGYAVASLLVAVALTLLLAYGARRLAGPWRAAAETLSALPLGTSSLLLGLGYVLSFGAGGLLDLRGSVGVIVVAHALIAFPFTARVLLPALALHDRRYDETAALLGASPTRVAWRIHLPLLRQPLLVAAGFAAALSLGDYGASLLLMRPDNMALSVWIGRHDAPFDPMLRAQAVALAGLLMLLTAAAYLAVEAAQPARGTRRRDAL